MKTQNCRAKNFVSSTWVSTVSPPSFHQTCMLCCAWITRGWLSLVGGLLELLVRARGWGWSTKNGGCVASLKWRGISKVLFSWKVWVTSKSCTSSWGAHRHPEKYLIPCEIYKHQHLEVLFIHAVDFSDLPPSLSLHSVNHWLRHETPALPRPPPSALTAYTNREPRERNATYSDHLRVFFSEANFE